jgi:hypothetical protein
LSNKPHYASFTHKNSSIIKNIPKILNSGEIDSIVETEQDIFFLRHRAGEDEHAKYVNDQATYKFSID